MFKIDDCFKSCSIFNEMLIKRFEDNFNPENGSRLWMTPGHVVFTTDNNKIHTCDARPYDLSSSPSEPEPEELLIAVAPVLDIYFDTETSSTRMFVVLGNGDVQIFEYRALLFEWARIGYFNVNITSPSSNSNHYPNVTQVLISHHQNMIYWCEQSDTSEMSFDLHKREVPLNDVREITQSSLGVPQKVLKNCPRMNLIEIRDNMCIYPHLPNKVNLYIILSARSHLWLFNINGKCLYRGSVTDSAIDFISLCAKTAGLWTQGSDIKVCNLLENSKEEAYILQNSTLLSINFTGEICRKVNIEINNSLKSFSDCFVAYNSLFSFCDELKLLYIHSIENGTLVQTIDLPEDTPIKGLWYHSSTIPCIGFYTDKIIYKVNFKSLSSLLNADPSCFPHANTILKQEYFHVFTLLKHSVHNKFEKSDFPPLKHMPKVLQSEALLLAVLHSCHEKGYRSENFPLLESAMNEIMNPVSEGVVEDTKLRESLRPLVDCFLQFEKSKATLCNTTMSTQQ